MTLVQCLLADVIVSLRTWVLWDRRKSVTAVLVVAWMCSTGVAIFYDVSSAQGITETSYGDLGLSGCSFTLASSTPLGNMYIAWAAYEMFMFGMTLLRGISHWRDGTMARMLTVLYRDAFLVSLAFSILAITEITLIHTNQLLWSYAFSDVYVAVKAVCAGRIILNIREAALSLDGWDIPTLVLPASEERWRPPFPEEETDF
ncbi:hypothetical protein CALCODRAFT_483252 [Calocera cornea HHB12733]|uniref:Uncharacterized protein n=1 Tax=Calocera cornea HHB12733 TaxID=1353952 RepID=A0A165FWV7_9BASI|nr:hypothetical protein CALCODRAFT_483252 [Calocera cornea HHB12733]